MDERPQPSPSAQAPTPHPSECIFLALIDSWSGNGDTMAEARRKLILTLVQRGKDGAARDEPGRPDPQCPLTRRLPRILLHCPGFGRISP